MNNMRIERIIATAIDWVICIFITGIIASILDLKEYSLFVLPCIVCLGSTLLEAFFKKTIGKMITGIEVITDNYTAISLGYMFLRNIIKITILPIDIVVFFMNSQGKALHDVWANTEVIKS